MAKKSAIRLGFMLENLAFENIHFSSLFALGTFRVETRNETSPAAKSEEKRMFSQAFENRTNVVLSWFSVARLIPLCSKLSKGATPRFFLS